MNLRRRGPQQDPVPGQVLLCVPPPTRPLIAQFRRRYPGVTVAVFEGTDQEVSDWIERRTVDLGVVTGPRPDLETVPLAEDEMLAVVPSGHRLAGRVGITVADLAGEPFLLSAGGCEPVIRRIHERHRIPLVPASQVTDMATLLAMVRGCTRPGPARSPTAPRRGSCPPGGPGTWMPRGRPATSRRSGTTGSCAC